ncbi:MAG TPA: ATP synthase F1 subunit delta [Candidatus Saccharimonadales bacterium]|nr:ATP synthase F1 subunit delta [Candidatus Saccharimonadales bacterium]
MAAIIARRYAQAVSGMLDSSEALERVERELVAFREILTKLPALGRILLHPGVPSELREQILGRTMDGLGCHQVTRAAARLLVADRGLRHLGSIAELLEKLREERFNVASARVTTALPVGNGDRPAWEAALSSVAGKPVRVTFDTDAELIGGAVARIGSVLYDGSVRGSLRRIRQSLLGE